LTDNTPIMNHHDAGSAACSFEDESIFACRGRHEQQTTFLKVPPGFHPVSLDNRPVVDSFLRSRSGRTSELTFTNLFMWRNHYNFCFCLQEDVLLIRGDHGGAGYFFEPVGRGLTADRVYSIMRSSGERSGGGLPLERVSVEFLESVLRGDSRFDVREAREHWDYIYSRDDLAYLRGRRYHGKRNHVARFEQTYRHDYLALDEGSMGECREVVEEWCRVRQCEHDPSLCAEKEAVTGLLDNYAHFNLIGGLVRVEDRPVAFTIGEAMDERTAVIHVEKALKGYHGLYQVINKLFCERALGGFELVNREQDLGIEGLRQAKESYFPVDMLKKYTVTLRE